MDFKVQDTVGESSDAFSRSSLSPHCLLTYSKHTSVCSVCESSSLNEVTFSFSTAPSPERSRKTVHATPRNINRLTHNGLDGTSDDSIVWGLKWASHESSCRCFKAFAWTAGSRRWRKSSSWTDRTVTLWMETSKGGLAEESVLCSRNAASFHPLWSLKGDLQDAASRRPRRFLLIRLLHFYLLLCDDHSVSSAMLWHQGTASPHAVLGNGRVCFWCDHGN